MTTPEHRGAAYALILLLAVLCFALGAMSATAAWQEPVVTIATQVA